MATKGKQGGKAGAPAKSGRPCKAGAKAPFHGCIAPAKLYEFKGQKRTLPEWGRLYGCSRMAIKRRFEGHGTPEPFTKDELLAKCPPPRKFKTVTWNGRTKTTEEWAKELGCSLHAIRCRIQRHGTPEAMRTVAAPKVVTESSSDSSDDPRANLYGFEGQWKTIDEWASEYGLTRSQCRRNFTLYGEPVKPYLSEDGDDDAEGAEARAVDKVLRECDAKNAPKKKYKFADILAEVDSVPSDNRSLREILGVQETFHLLDSLGV